MPDATVVAIWVADHLSVLGWPTFIGFVWKLKGSFDRYNTDMSAAREAAASAASTTQKLQTTLDTIQNNHLLHLSQDVKEIHDIYDRHTELLTSIDRGIAVLVDRGKNREV
jgi:hypothetical protein